jgi:M6 family metalloprotease-like protein
MSSPFYQKHFTFTQPDGTTLEVIGSGNQRSAVFQTVDGFTVVRDPATGYYEYATTTVEGGELIPTGVTAPLAAPALLDALGVAPALRPSREAARSASRQAGGLPAGGNRWEQRRREARRARDGSAPGVALAPPSRQTIGSYVGLCLLIDFPDTPGTITQQEVERFCNRPGYTGFGNNGSVFDYFADASGGKLQYTNIVTPYYRARRARSYYTNPNVEISIRARELIREALSYWRDQSFDFSTLTIDGTGCVFALNVLYAGPRVNNWREGLWPHQHYLATPFKLDGQRRAHDYQITNMGHELTLGTFCHENGHMVCDFPDLYDYGPESRGVGRYCLMCAGGALDEKNPGELGAYLKRAAGWGTTIQLSSGQFSARANANEFFVYGKNRTEYFLIENRVSSGRDAVLASSGLAIWHVDENGHNDNEQMTSERHYECSLIQADGKHQLERGANDGDPGDLYGPATKTAFGDTTHPRSVWWDGAASGLEIDGISAPGPTVTFTVK